MEHELPEVLDGADEPVSVEELEAVVRRAAQRRRASLVAGAAGLLLCGAVGGALARGPVDDRSTGFASTESATSPPNTMPPRGMALDMGGPFWGPLTSLFRRDANGVAIRAYRSAPPAGQPGPLAPDGCKGWGTIHGELSSSAAVGFAPAPDLPGDTFLLLSAGKFGQAEGDPATWATVRTGAGVTTARLKQGAATDTMAPQAGIALLAVPGDGGDGFVEGLDPEGKVVATQKLSEIAHPAPDPACWPPCEVVKPGMPAQVEPLKPGQDPPATLPPPPPPLPDQPATTSSDSPVTTLAAPPFTRGPDAAANAAMEAGPVLGCDVGPPGPPPYPSPYPAPALPAPPHTDGPSSPATATTVPGRPPSGASTGAPGPTSTTLSRSATAPPVTGWPPQTSTAPPTQAP